MSPDRKLAWDAWCAATAHVQPDEQLSSNAFAEWWAARDRSIAPLTDPEQAAADIREVAHHGEMPPEMDALVRAGLAERRRETHVVTAWPGPVLDVDGDHRGPRGWIQWKGTEVCIDLHCSCGHHGHYDGGFLYFYRCRGCGGAFAVGSTVRLYPVDETRYGAVERAKLGMDEVAADGVPFTTATAHPRMFVERGGEIVPVPITAEMLKVELAKMSGEALTIAAAGLGVVPRFEQEFVIDGARLHETDEALRERILRSWIDG